MRSSERQFNALTPEESGEQFTAETNVETTEAVENPRPISETETSVSYLGVDLEKATVKGGAYVPKREQYEDFINDTEVSLPLQRDLAVAFLNGEPILVDGGTSIGKTTTVRKMASELGYEVHYANLNGATDVEDLMGRYIPNPHKRGPEDPEYIFADGKVTSGLRQEKGKVKVIILDEYNAAAPNILIRLHEVLDAVERGGDVVLSEDASEEVSVNKERTKIVALMNPPGKGYIGREPIDPAQLRRWVYKKAPSELPESTFSHSTDVLFGGDNESQEVPKTDYLKSRDTALTPEQLQEIPGLQEILAKYKEFHKASKELLKNRKIAEDQPQPFTYDDRMEPRRVRDFILKFYNGDINETFQQALQYYYANKLETKVDKEKLSEIIRTVEYIPKVVESKRKGLDDRFKEITWEGKTIGYTETPFFNTEVGAQFKEKDTGKTWTLDGTWVRSELVGMTPQISGVLKSGEEFRVVGSEELKESFEKASSPESSPGSRIEKVEKGETTQEKAKEIMGKYFFGLEAMNNTFGIARTMPEEFKKVPYSEAELEQAKKNGEMLVFRYSMDAEPSTMKDIYERLDKVFKSGDGKVLYDTDWYENEDLFTKQPVREGWALVSKDVIEGSTSKNYIDQTATLRDYLKEVDSLSADELAECTDDKLDQIRTLMSGDWEAAAKKLAELKINQNHRRTPTEALYDFAIRFKNTPDNERMLENMYDWTNARASDGDLVGFGRTDSWGADLGRWHPRRTDGGIGVVSVR
jgi:AAA domain (dynein-related subfamily)